MYANVRHLIDELGGYRAVSRQLGVGPTTLHSHMAAGLLPPKWYLAFRELARLAEKPEPQLALFAFEELSAEGRAA